MTELEKFDDLEDIPRIIAEFIEAMAGLDLSIGEQRCSPPRFENLFIPTIRSNHSIICECYGIDEKQLEIERRELLKSTKEANNGPDTETNQFA